MLITATANGSPLHLGCQDVRVASPDGHNIPDWRYVTAPPHGDGLFEVKFEGITSPELFWGRGLAWSPTSDSFTVEQYTAQRDVYCGSLDLSMAAGTNRERITRSDTLIFHS